MLSRKLSMLLLMVVLTTISTTSIAQQRYRGDRSGETSAAIDRLRKEAPSARIVKRGKKIKKIFGFGLSKGSTPKTSTEKFRNEYAAVFGVGSDDIKAIKPKKRKNVATVPPEARGLMYDPETQRYKLLIYRYRQEHHGIPVFRSELRLTVRNSEDYPLVLVGSSLRNLNSFMPPRQIKKFTINEEKTIQSIPRNHDFLGNAKEAPHSLINYSEPEPVIFAGIGEQKAVPRLAMVYEADSDNSFGSWLFVADAHTGNILYSESLVQYADVTGTVYHYETPDDGAMECSEPEQHLTKINEIGIVGGASTATEINGNFTIPNSGSLPVDVSTEFKSEGFDVFDELGNDYYLQETVIPGEQSSLVMGASDPDNVSYLAQANAYGTLTEVLINGIILFPDIAEEFMWPNFTVRVNLPSTFFYRLFYGCPGNAGYRSPTGGNPPSIVVCAAGTRSGVSYSNFSFRSVLLHEFGHHLVHMAGSGQGEYGEGFSDAYSALVTGNPDLARGYILNQCSTPLRSADNNCQYLASPNCSSCGSEIHDCGQLLSGIVWDIYEELGLYPTLNLLVHSVFEHEGTAIDEDIATDFLTLDDDDGIIENGTPNDEAICTAFENHGITCPISL